MLSDVLFSTLSQLLQNDSVALDNIVDVTRARAIVFPSNFKTKFQIRTEFFCTIIKSACVFIIVLNLCNF